MKYLILFLLFPFMAFGQGKVPFAISGVPAANAYAYTNNGIWTDSAVLLTKYKMLSDTVVLGIDASGKAYRITKPMIQSWGSTNGLVWSDTLGTVITRYYLSNALQSYLTWGDTSVLATQSDISIFNQAAYGFTFDGATGNINYVRISGANASFSINGRYPTFAQADSMIVDGAIDTAYLLSITDPIKERSDTAYWQTPVAWHDNGDGTGYWITRDSLAYPDYQSPYAFASDSAYGGTGPYMTLTGTNTLLNTYPVGSFDFAKLATVEYDSTANIFTGTVEYGNPPTTGARISTTNGSLLSTPGYVRTTKFTVPSSRVISFAYRDTTGAFGSLTNVIEYTSADAFIQTDTVKLIPGGFQITTKPTCAKVALNLSNTSQTGFTSTFQANLSYFLQPYSVPGVYSSHNELRTDVLDAGLSKDTTYSVNLFDPSMVYVGNLGSVPTCTINNATLTSKYFSRSVEPNTWYKLDNWEVAFASKKISEYGATGTALGCYQVPTGTGDSYSFKTGSSTYNIVVQIKNNSDDDSVWDRLSLTKGLSSPQYAAHTDPTETVNHIDNTKIKDYYDSTAVLNVITSNKEWFGGNSYTQGFYHPKGKGWVEKLSNLVEWPCFDYGVSGNRAIDVLERFRSNTAGFTAFPQAMKGDIFWIACVGNETLLPAWNADFYLQEFKEVAEQARRAGMNVVFSTDFRVTFGTPLVIDPWVESALYDLAEQYDNVWFVPSGVYGNQVLQSQHSPGMWGNGHPGVRTNSQQFGMQLYGCSKLPPARQSLKVFYKRPAYTPANLNSLICRPGLETARMFAEISTGATSLKQSDSSYRFMDTLNTLTPYNVQLNNNDYATLAAKQPVAFSSNYALVRAKLAVVNPQTVTFQVAGSAGLSFYLKNNASPYSHENTTEYNAVFLVDSATYYSITFNTGDTYTSPLVTNGGVTPLTATSKFYDWRIGYCVAFTFSSLGTATSGGSGTLTRTSGTGTSSIPYVSMNNDLKYSANFLIGTGRTRAAYDTLNTTYTSGYYTVTITTPQDYMDKDNMDLLIYGSSNFTLSDIQVTYKGGEAKNLKVKEMIYPASGADLISNKTFNSTATGWTTNGTIQQYPSRFEHMPPIAGANYFVTLKFNVWDSSQTLKTTVTFPSSDGYRWMDVKVAAETFPKMYIPASLGGTNTTLTTTTRELDTATYDYNNLCLSIVTAGQGKKTLRSPLSTGYQWVFYRVLVPPFTTTMDLEFARDPMDIVDKTTYYNHTWDMNIAYVSAILENQ